MMNDNKIIDYGKEYLNWLKQNIYQYRVNDSTFRITLPFLDRNNDMVEVYIIDKKNGNFVITDDGSTINDLLLSGFDFSSSERRKGIFLSTVNSYGVTLTNNDELMVECTSNDLFLKKHMLVQCIIKVSDMFTLSKNNIQSLFYEDVQNYLDKNDVRYIDDIIFIGKSKLTTHYDFAIAGSKHSPERLIKVVNKLDVGAARNIIFAWNDTRDVRKKDAKLYTFIQDTDKKYSKDAMGALKEYKIQPTLWSERDKVISELVA